MSWSDYKGRRRSWARSALVQAELFVQDRVRLRREMARFHCMPDDLRDRVTIPIATYDRIDILVERTIPALLGQTHQDIEVIIVGDGTDSALFAKVERVPDPRVRTILLPQRTAYPADPLERWMVAGWKARNCGAGAATGGWLLWVSDDDIVLPQGIETLVRFAHSHPAADVVSAGFEVQARPPFIDLPSTSDTGLPMAIAGMPALMARTYTRAFRWNGQSHLKSWNRPSDYDLLMRMHRAGMKFASVDEVVAIVPEVAGTGGVGSQAFAAEERRRGESGDVIPTSDGDTN